MSRPTPPTPHPPRDQEEPPRAQTPAIPPSVTAQLTTLLCDADGNLFASEEPAFAASAEVTNRFLAELGDERRFTAEELRLAATGMNFRTTARRFAAEAGRPDVDVEPWVAEEKRAVTAHLAEVLRPHQADDGRAHRRSPGT